MLKTRTIIIGCIALCIITTQARAQTDLPLDPATNGKTEQTEAALFQEIPSVFGSAKYEQKINEAPASVTIITAEQIKKYGYRQLSQILDSVPGMFMTNDRDYGYVGFRGFGRPGDYNTRVLLLVDSHRLNDATYDQAALGSETPIDVDVIERVEIIRGPASSLYGTNAFLGVINVITKKGRDIKGIELSAETSSYNSNRGRLTIGKKLQNGVEFLLSGNYYGSIGNRSLFYKEFDSPATNNGVADKKDHENYSNMLGKISYGDFSLQGGLSWRKKQIPTASFGTVFNDSRNGSVDQRGYLDLKYQHDFANEFTVKGRLYYDQYYYRGDYVYDYAGTGVPPFTLNQDHVNSEWVGGELTLIKRLLDRHKVTLGSEYREQFRTHQQNDDQNPPATYLNDKRHSNIWALYAQDEFSILDNLVLNVGVRHDQYSTFGGTTNPRAALIYNLNSTTLKLLYGRAFRAPNPFEQYYVSATTFKTNPNLQPETITTYEAVVEQQFGQHIRGIASFYRNDISDLISQRLDPGDGRIFFDNVDAVKAKGMELTVEGKWPTGLEGRVSYALQEARDTATDQILTNSPSNMAKLNLIVPLLQDKLFGGIETRYLSKRRTLAGNDTDAVFVTNLTLFSQRFVKGWEWSAQLSNIFNNKYADPGANDHVQDTIAQDGRTFWLKLKYRY